MGQARTIGKMKQAKQLKGFTGGRGMGFFDIGDEARKEFPNWNYGEAFAYLWRRFGPPEIGWDGYKQLVNYYLTTKMKGLYLTCSPYLDDAAISFGFMFDENTIGAKIAADISKPKEEWSDYTKIVHSTLCDAMRELKRPTNVRDWFINIEGHVKDEDIHYPVNYSIRTGFGIEPDYFHRFERKGPEK